jgi:hypothetical protein
MDDSQGICHIRVSANRFHSLITMDHSWRVIYYVAVALIGAVLLLAFFTFPETSYIRHIDQVLVESPAAASETEAKTILSPSTKTLEKDAPELRKKKSYKQSLQIFVSNFASEASTHIKLTLAIIQSGVYTDESLLTLFIRPFALILLPPVLWSACTMAVTIGFLVAVTSNVSPAFEAAYGFKPYQTGLCFFAAIIGSLIGIYCGGHLSDQVADFLTKRNKGIREPEMRLPAIAISCITGPLSLILYGIGIHHSLHWIVPTIGLGLLNFSIVQASNIVLVYTIDAYRPITGEVSLAATGFKSAFGFLLSFYTNPWIDEVGYQNAYGSMAGIAAAVLLCWVPMYIWGKRIRHATWRWRITRFVKWNDDRFTGE